MFLSNFVIESIYIMPEIDIEVLKYPIGKFIFPKIIDQKLLATWIVDIERFPELLENLVMNLTVGELNLQYRPNGWTLKQVVHHCADSHMNAFIRFKLALTEDAPIIKPYQEDRWAILDDAMDDQIEVSVSLLKALHYKWATLLQNLSSEDLKRVYIHPNHNKPFTLEVAIGLYAWHCNHHLNHIQQGLKFKGKF